MPYTPLRLAALLLPCITLAGSAAAGELDLFAGRLSTPAADPTTAGWMLEYRQALDTHLAASFAWVNDGHLPNHHRDGQAAQLWWRSGGGPGLVLEAGLGPYRLYDGTWQDHGYYPTVSHRWGALASVAVDWYATGGWFGYLRANHVAAVSDFDSTTIGAGVGYRFAANPEAAGGGAVAPGQWEVDALVGRREQNTHPTPAERVGAVGVRAHLAEHVVASVTLLDSDAAPPDWRKGVAMQLWLEQALGPRLSVGAGLGGLLARNPPPPANFDWNNRGLIPDYASQPMLLTSITVGYALAAHWRARLGWDRVAGRFNDADLVLAGVGYVF